MSQILLVAAIIPIIALCAFIYMKDKNKEPKGLLALLFICGFFSVIPIMICELVFGMVFPMENAQGFISIFLNVMFGVALFEELFKWLITKFLGYNNKAFDEVFDVIVYAVFASLGFACFENILYVFQYGLLNAIMRAFLSIPGHTCFAISMGFFLSKAKVAQINGNKGLHSKNMILSLVVPIVLHTFYDALLFNASSNTLSGIVMELLPFVIFYAGMVAVCFITVDKTAKVQQNLTTNLNNGSIMRNVEGYLYYNYPTTPVSTTPASMNQNMGIITPVSNVAPVSNNTGFVPTNIVTPVSNVAPNTTPTVTNQAQTFVQQTPNTLPPVVEPSAISGVFPDSPVAIPSVDSTMITPSSEPVVTYQELKYCPICGKPTKGEKFCGRCGFRLK
mgnify:CR=1 FL=1